MIEYLTLGQFVIAVLMGLAALCAFLWGAASGALSDVEAVKHRVLEEVEPMAYRFLLSFAKDNELKVRDGRIAERSKLAELQRVGDTA